MCYASHEKAFKRKDKKKMTRKDILNYIKEERRDDKQLKNIAMFLIDKRHFAKSIAEIEMHDIDILLDNLFINNEIIDADNVKDYFTEDTSEYKKIVNNNKILLLNYYDIKDSLKRCKIYLDNVNYYEL